MGVKFLAILSAWLFTVQLCAQLNSDTVHTKEDLLLLERNARLSLTKALIVEDMDSIRYWRDLHVVRELKRGPRERALFDPRSRAVLNFQLGDVHALLEDIRRGEHYFNFAGYGLLSDVVTYRFLDVWALRTDLILDKIGSAAILPQERELLMVYWMEAFNHLHAYSYGIAYSQQYINEQANLLLGTELDHAYEQFLRDHIRQEYEASRHEWGASVGIGSYVFTDQLSPLLDPGLVGTTRFEYLRSRYQLFVEADFGSAPAADQFLLDTLDLSPGDRLTWMNVSAGGGLLLFDGERARAILSAGVQGLSISRPIQDTIYSSGFFVQPVGTISFDLKIKRNGGMPPGWRGLLDEWRGSDGHPTSIRLLFGYTPNAFTPGIQHRGGMFFATIGVALHWRTPIRVH